MEVVQQGLLGAQAVVHDVEPAVEERHPLGEVGGVVLEEEEEVKEEEEEVKEVEVEEEEEAEEAEEQPGTWRSS